MKKRSAGPQFVFALPQAESWTPVVDITPKMVVRDPTFYGWNKLHGGSVSLRKKTESRRRKTAARTGLSGTG